MAMMMSLDLEIRDRLTRYLRGDSSLSEFRAWFVPATWDVTPESNPSAADLSAEIHLRLAEYDRRHWTEAELQDRLRPLAEYFTLTVKAYRIHLSTGSQAKIIRSEWAAAAPSLSIRPGTQSVKVFG
jgi:hypothetical protein